MEAARRARDVAWLERVRRTYGSEPTVQYFVTPLVADNALGKTIIDEDQSLEHSHPFSADTFVNVRITEPLANMSILVEFRI